MIQMQLRSIVIFVLFNVVFGVMSGYTDNACHFGGLLAGLLCGAAIAKFAPSPNDATSRVAIIGLAVLALAGTTFALERSRGYMFHAANAAQLQQEGRNQEAIAELQKVVSLRPNNVAGHLSLADAYFRSKQYPQAEAELKRTLALDPQNTEAPDYLGFVYLAENRPADAESMFSKLIAKNYSLAEAHYGLGMALSAEGKDQPAVEEYKTALGMRPQFEGAHYQLGLSEDKLQQYDSAIADFQKELQLTGEDPEVETALAHAYQAKGESDKAADALQKAAKVKGK
jgi:tetratricopeptide (TPR) repeat protein